MSYNVALERVLLYKQIAGQTEGNLRALNLYLTDRSQSRHSEYLRQRDILSGYEEACRRKKRSRRQAAPCGITGI